MRKYQDFTNKKIGRLMVVSISHRSSKSIIWDCVCDCGNKTKVTSGNLKSGHTNSCGCIWGEGVGTFNLKHGMCYTRFNKIYRGIKFRSKKSFIGGIYLKNVKCEWKTFKDFKRDMYKSYLYHIKKYGEEQTSIDRINGNGNYCKENCRWATRSTQSLNRRTAFLIKYNGKIKNLSEWGEITGLRTGLIRERILAGWTPAQALTIKPKLGQKINKRNANLSQNKHTNRTGAPVTSPNQSAV